MLVLACYTEDTPYEAEAAVLRASLERVGMAHLIEGYRSAGDWYANTAAKAGFIQRCRTALSGPLLYVDVDAFVHVDCTAYFEGLAAEGYDFGAHYFAGPSGGNSRTDVCRCVPGRSCSRKHRLLSGTLFFGDTDPARRLVETWVYLNAMMRKRGMVQGGRGVPRRVLRAQLGHQCGRVEAAVVRQNGRNAPQRHRQRLHRRAAGSEKRTRVHGRPT
jgi:hypothetical protein